MWKQISDALTKTVDHAGQHLIHVGGDGIPGRTAVVWKEGLALTLAREATDGESVPVVLADGKPGVATVQAFDPKTGLTVLKVPGTSGPTWKTGALPRVGNLVLAVAFPSPQGVEARLDLVRFVGGENSWGRGVMLQNLIQTDGASFPGFTGAVLLDADGHLVGIVADNHPGNGGFVVAFDDLARFADALVATGSPKQAWLGVSTKPAGGQGLVLLNVDAASPASQAGWKASDLLVSLAGQSLRSPRDLVTVLAGLTPQVSVPARILRDGEVHELPVTPGSR